MDISIITTISLWSIYGVLGFVLLTTAIISLVAKLKNAKTPEEKKEAINEFVDDVKDGVEEIQETADEIIKKE